MQYGSCTLAKYFFLGLNLYVVFAQFPTTSLVFREVIEKGRALLLLLSHVNLPRLLKRGILA